MMHSINMTRANEIMARYRPIAPKPPQSSLLESTPPLPPGKASGITLPARTSKARKRGRAGFSRVSQKRAKTCYPVLSSPDTCHGTTQLDLSMHFSHGFTIPFPVGTGFHGNDLEKPTNSADLLTLSLLPCSSSVPPLTGTEHAKETNEEVKEKDLDLNCEPETVPVEKDLLQSLQKPHVIVPHPVRPVGSSISVGYISEDRATVALAPVSKKPEQVEDEVESDDSPAVVSDCNNRVRLANSAYKEMVGQPECSWLASMATNSGAGLKAASKRINGEVMLGLSDSSVPESSNGFSCRVTIEWACNGRKSVINAPCDVERLSCESKDYLFIWRFHTTEAFDTNCKA